MLTVHQKRKIWKYNSVVFNLFWSILYFKQLIYPNDEKYIYILSRIMLLPFIYLIAFMLTLLTPSKKSFKKEFWILLVPLVFIIGIVQFMFYAHAFNYIFLFLFILIEPLKNRFIDNNPIIFLSIKYFMLFIISFILGFVGYALPELNATANASVMWMGGIYFLILIIIDYKLPVLVQKFKNSILGNY